MCTRVNRCKIRTPVSVAAEVREKGLLDAARDSRQFVNGLLETIDIRGIGLGRRVSAYLGGNVVESCQAVLPVESNDWFHPPAAHNTAAIIVDIKTELEFGSKRV